MVVGIISDTHGLHHNFTEQIKALEVDVLIHAGDVTGHGTWEELDKFVEWFGSFKHIPFKCFVGGNHDETIEQINNNTDRLKVFNQFCTHQGVTYIHHRTVEFGGYKFYGSNMSPAFLNWYNMYDRKHGAILWSMIPDDTNVLITHTPAFQILDKVEGWGGGNVGCEELRNRLDHLKDLKLFCCGHIHNGYGMSTELGFPVVNGALLNEQYRPVNKPIIVEI